jgi:hypothetical protein
MRSEGYHHDKPEGWGAVHGEERGRIPDGTKARFRKDGREGITGGLTELVVGPGRKPDSRTQYRSNVGNPDRTLALEGDLLVLTDEDGVVIMVKQKGEYRRVVPSCKQCLPLIAL